MHCPRCILAVKWQDCRTSTNYCKNNSSSAGKDTFGYIIQEKRLQLFGVICRMRDNSLLKTVEVDNF